MQNYQLPETIEPYLKEIKRVVIKVGTRVIDNEKTQFNRPAMEALAADICDLKSRGIEVMVVSSGAVGAGMRSLGVQRRPPGIHLRQAYAAIGQSQLMCLYNELFAKHNTIPAQVLLTRNDLDRRNSYLNARETLQHLLTIGVTPIINENDTVSVDELKFGDNDALASLVAGKMDANLLILLTTVDGLFRSFKKGEHASELIEVISGDYDSYFSSVQDEEDPLSLGGMRSKLEAGKNACAKGVLVAIANGLRVGIIHDLLTGNAPATWMIPAKKRMAAWKYYLAYAKRPSGGKIYVDDGAVAAIRTRGKSLLASGIRSVVGSFKPKDLVQVVDIQGNEFARGLSNFSSEDAKKIIGCSSKRIREILKGCTASEVIHRDNLVLR